MNEGFSKYPLDFQSLQRGQVISQEELASMLPAEDKENLKKLELFTLSIRDRIEKEFIERGDAAWIKSENGGLRILDHAEQSAWLEKEANRHRRGLRKGMLFLSQVDPERLTSEERKSHDRRLIVEGRYLQAQQKVSKQLALEKGEDRNLLNGG